MVLIVWTAIVTPLGHHQASFSYCMPSISILFGLTNLSKEHPQPLHPTTSLPKHQNATHHPPPANPLSRYNTPRIPLPPTRLKRRKRKLLRRLHLLQIRLARHLHLAHPRKYFLHRASRIVRLHALRLSDYRGD